MPSDEQRRSTQRVDLTSRRAGEALELAIAGELDMPATFELEPELERLIDAPDVSRVECDLAGVSFFDSAGLGLLLALRERAQRRGVAMTMVNVSEPVRRILTVSGTGIVLIDDEAR